MAFDAPQELWRLGREIEGIRRSSATTDEATERLLVRGSERAKELGWHDVYTFSKSLAERMVVREHEELPLVIVRPAICVSSLREPYPG
jgi:hypothetical protein